MRRWNIYFVRAGEYIKIGMTKDVNGRMSAIQTGNPIKLELCGVIDHLTKEQAHSYERRLHNFFSALRVKGEWFKTNRFEQYHAESKTIIYGDGGLSLDSVLEL